VSEVYKATYEGMFEDSVFVIMNNQTQTWKIILFKEMDGANIYTHVPTQSS
jgi:hypothetical protein